MSEINRCALLDTDFISKLYITKANDSDRLIFRILGIPGFQFICHEQTKIELGRYNQWATKWLKEDSGVTIYTDRRLTELLINFFGDAAYGIYVDKLKKSCDIFSATFFETYYKPLEQYIEDDWGSYDLDVFISLIEGCDIIIGEDNNLGEIKLYTTAQILSQLGESQLYVFCSDDRKARYSMSTNANAECVSALSSFYLAKKYLNLEKTDAKVFFDSWMAYHRSHKQEHFQVYSRNGDQRPKLLGEDIFEMLYNDELYLMKDGLLRIS